MELYNNASIETQQFIIELGCKVFQLITTKTHLKIENDDNYLMLLKETIKDKDLLIKEMQSNNEYIQSENESLKSKFLCDNVKKGQNGEQGIELYLANNFSDIEIENTTKQTACGDLNANINNVKFLIEIKNKYQITKDDISKFKRDVLNKQSEVGVFVCTKNIKIPYKGQISFEIHENIPLLYVTDFDNNPIWLKMCIDLGNKIVKKMKSKNTSIETLTTEIYELTDFINSMQPILKDLIKDSTKVTKNLKSLEKLITDRIENFEK